jgi:tRNA threonylcarbamoyladenosine biosynthesis protein TsaB
MRLTPDSIAAVTVATGPGSFSGLRVGMAIANGLAAAVGIPTIGVSTLAVTVRPWLALGRPVIGVIKAGRSRYGWAADDGIETPSSGTVAALIDFVRLRPTTIVVGELSDADAVRVREVTDARVVAEPDRLRRVAVLARIGWDRWQSGEFDPDAIPEPTYLHRI